MSQVDRTPVSGRSYELRDIVRYKRWTGFVYEVQSDGRLLIDFTDPLPTPFFRGPYRPEEVARVYA